MIEKEDFAGMRAKSLPHVVDASKQRQQRGEWQPIETAPTDGSSVLTFGTLHEFGEHVGETPACQISRYARIGGWISRDWGSHAPTHWMPLPAPPATEVAG